MIRRTWILLRARLAMARRTGWPVPALLLQALLGALFAALVRDALPPYPYALFALCLNALLIAIPLVGELGGILRRDEGREWISAQPLRPVELALARALHLLLLLLALDLAALVPAALLAPPGLGIAARIALPLLGFGLVTLVAALFLGLERALARRAEALFLGLQAALVLGVVVGLVGLLGRVHELARLEPGGGPGWFPPVWFAAALAGGASGAWALALVSTAAALALLFLLPPPAEHARAQRASLLVRLLRPFRAAAVRVWVRRDERAAFDLVYDALPREREVVLRTYPMFGIPLAFLALAARRAEGGAWRPDALALLLFTVGVYLPVLLTHVPATESPRASWILATAPVPRAALDSGAIKALFVRFLLPLQLALALIAWTLAGTDLVLRLWPAALLVSLLVLRLLYPMCVRDPPLSIAPDDVRGELDWLGSLSGLALALAVAAVLANRFLLTPGAGLAVAALLLAVELVWGRAARR